MLNHEQQNNKAGLSAGVLCIINRSLEILSQAKEQFSFKEERDFSTIEEDIAALEAKIEENQSLQAAAGSDYVKLQQLQDQLTELEAQLEHKEERWMYLTELKEKSDAQGK